MAYDTSTQIHDTSTVDLENLHWNSMGSVCPSSLVSHLLLATVQRLSMTGFNVAIFVETIALTKPFTIPTLNLTFLHHA